MTRREALLQKARNNPKGMRFAELIRLASLYHWLEDRQDGSHHILVKEDTPGIMDFQEDRNGKAKPYQVKQLLGWIDEHTED